MPDGGTHSSRRVWLADADQTCAYCGKPWSEHQPSLPDDPDGPMVICPAEATAK